jgi:hypothetical protein
MQDRCTVCVKREKASEIILGITDGTPGDVGQLEAHFGLLEIVLILTQERCPICAKHAIRSQIILVTSVKWKLVSVCTEALLISAQDRCTVCAECTTSIGIFLATPDGPPR